MPSSSLAAADIAQLHQKLKIQQHVLDDLDPLAKVQGEMRVRCMKCQRFGVAERTNRGTWRVTGRIVEERCEK